MASGESTDHAKLELADWPGLALRYWPQYYDASVADGLAAALMAELQLTQPQVRMFGQWRKSPRLAAWYGDAGASYRYSGQTYEPLPWTSTLAQLRQDLAQLLGVPFNSVLANLYRNGADSMGWHADDEPELGPEPVIASLSLGAVRRFDLKSRQAPLRRWSVDLAHGSLLVMEGRTQAVAIHQVPKQPKIVASRINLTFRVIGERRR